MKLLYMGYYCEDDFFNTLSNNNYDVSHAAHQLEKNIIKGLVQHGKITKGDIISYIPTTNLSIKSKYNNTSNIKFLYCNKKSIVSVVKAILINIVNLIKWSYKNKNQDSVILMYSTNLLHAVPAILLKKTLNFKVITICTEISTFRRIKNPISRVIYKLQSFLDNSFDGYVLLTEQMNEKTNRNKKPYVVMEGIATDFNDIDMNSVKEKAIMYAGGLSYDNGINELISVFLNLPDKSYELWICGSGECEDLVKNAAKKDLRIKYYGVLPNEEIRKLEKKAMILVNIRYSNSEFTKYSFPSKLLEYMASGTPVISTKLPGIPEVYFQYLYPLIDESEQGLTKRLNEILSSNKGDLEQVGRIAKEFVIKEKNYKIQSKKIMDFLERM